MQPDVITNSITCETCNGWGFFITNDEKRTETCPRCNGQGELDVDPLVLSFPSGWRRKVFNRILAIAAVLLGAKVERPVKEDRP